MIFWMETLTTFFKKSKHLLKNLEMYEVIPIELFVDMKNLHKFVEVAHKTMLENLVHMNVYI
jgi:hypothetical protein